MRFKKKFSSSSAFPCYWSRFNGRWKDGRIPGLTNLKIPATPQPWQHAPCMSLPSNMCRPWNFLCFLLCTHVLQYNPSLEKEEVEDVFNFYANAQLLITLVLRSQKQTGRLFTMIALPRRGWRIDIQHFHPFFICTICVLSSPGYDNDSSAGNKLSGVVRVL